MVVLHDVLDSTLLVAGESSLVFRDVHGVVPSRVELTLDFFLNGLPILILVLSLSHSLFVVADVFPRLGSLHILTAHEVARLELGSLDFFSPLCFVRMQLRGFNFLLEPPFGVRPFCAGDLIADPT